MPTLAEELHAIGEEARRAVAEKLRVELEAEIKSVAADVITCIPNVLREAAKRRLNETHVYRIGACRSDTWDGKEQLGGAAKIIWDWLRTQPGLHPSIRSGPIGFREETIPEGRFSIFVRW